LSAKTILNDIVTTMLLVIENELFFPQTVR